MQTFFIYDEILLAERVMSRYEQVTQAKPGTSCLREQRDFVPKKGFLRKENESFGEEKYWLFVCISDVGIIFLCRLCAFRYGENT